MELVSKAIIFATKAHDGMRRKQSDIPYIFHPLEAATIVSTMTSDQEVISAAILHDVVEDANIKIEDIEKNFNAAKFEQGKYEPINKKIRKTILSVAKSNGIDSVVNAGAMIAGGKDLTKEVITALKM